MHTFKVGDKVKCLDDSDTRLVTRGRVYTVTENDGYFVRIDYGHYWYTPARFEAAPEEVKAPETKGYEWLLYHPVDDVVYTYGTREEAEKEAAKEAGTVYPARVYKLVSEAKVTMEDVG